MTTGIDRDVSARKDWEERISDRSDQRDTAPVPELPPPAGARCTR